MLAQCTVYPNLPNHISAHPVVGALDYLCLCTDVVASVWTGIWSGKYHFAIGQNVNFVNPVGLARVTSSVTDVGVYGSGNHLTSW